MRFLYIVLKNINFTVIIKLLFKLWKTLSYLLRGCVDDRFTVIECSRGACYDEILA